jgi:hypothetical protein
LNHPNTTCGAGDLKNFCITDLSSYTEDLGVTSGTPDHQIYLSFGNVRQERSEVYASGKYEHFMGGFRVIFVEFHGYLCCNLCSTVQD